MENEAISQEEVRVINLVLSGLEQYTEIQRLRDSDADADTVYLKVHKLYTEKGKAHRLLKEKYNPLKGKSEQAFLTKCFVHDFYAKFAKAKSQKAEKGIREIPLDYHDPDKEKEAATRKEISKALEEQSKANPYAWVREAVLTTLPSHRPAYAIAQLLLDLNDSDVSFTDAGNLLHFTKKQIETAKAEVAAAIVASPDAEKMWVRVKNCAKRGANLWMQGLKKVSKKSR